MSRVHVFDGVLVLLAAAAGWLDGTAYLRAHVFIANMTGNTVLLGLGLGHYAPGRIVRPITAIAAFVCGAFSGSAIAEAGTSAPRGGVRALAIETVLLAAFAMLWFFFSGREPLVLALIALASFSMGIQQAATERLHPAPAVSTTYQGGTVEKLGAGLYKALKGEPRTLLMNGAIWLVYLTSAVGVALLGKAVPPLLGIVPFLVVAASIAAIALASNRQGTIG